jgi:hypothetical protein
MEKKIADLTSSGSEVTVPTKPYEIKTIQVQFADVASASEKQ